MGTSKALVIKVFILFTVFISFRRANALVCNEKEKQALLSFKHALTDPTNRLSSWSPNADCCGWTGVRCDNVLGRVVGIHLGNWNDTEATGPHGILGGEISPALLELQFLNHLDLSHNNFGGNPIPSFLGSMQSLSVLLLLNTSFGGIIPPQLGNLSGLRELVLGCLDALSCELYAENLSWISRLSSLETLVIQRIDLHKEVYWLENLSVLPSLTRLYLIQCQLGSMSPSLEYVNFTSLSRMYLPFNNFNHELPNWLFNLGSNLMYLDLSCNSLQGQIPSTISNLHNLVLLNFTNNNLKGQIPESLVQLKCLQELYLSFNSLDGQIPSNIGSLSSLSTLYLLGNQLSGDVPVSIGLLSNLERLVIGSNQHLSGIVSEVHFTTLSKLMYLMMSRTNITLNVSSNWIPPFQLKRVGLFSCNIGPKFPAWLLTQRSLEILSISNTGIEDTAPSWLWKWASQIPLILDLSDNRIAADLSKVLLNNSYVDLSSNRFTGQLPLLSKNVIELRIANNSFPGQISSFLCREVNGGSELKVLDLSNNLLSGELVSNCLMYWPSLSRLNLGNNNLYGNIPDSVASLFALEALHLSDNALSGNVPASLQNCTFLSLLDLSENKLSGSIPSWIGESNLLVLSLRSNRLIGDIPPQICQLISTLIVLDLANNKLSGAIPKCIGNFSTMVRIDTAHDNDFNVMSNYIYMKYDELQLVVKGRKYEYSSILPLVRTIDFSSNDLSGSIPTEFSSLSGLRFLNLSRNHLKGTIPEKVGHMQTLESLDLSRNNLSGAIPESMTSLPHLAHLDLSYNHLWGRIPSGTQLQSFNATSFMGNAGLCGDPLTIKCKEMNEILEAMDHTEESREDFEMAWYYIGMASGFNLIFWGVFIVPLLKREWRGAYFRFLDETRDQMCAATVQKWKWFQEHFMCCYLSERRPTSPRISRDGSQESRGGTEDTR